MIERSCGLDNARVLVSEVNSQFEKGTGTYPIAYPQAKAIEETNV